ncbi:MAG: LysM peptidoglycan-binding domain-containing protein [Clostridiales bacterium]|nr:LysM peptidoglycan-binding domain-containing protein [Clostridiales bacterium]
MTIHVVTAGQTLYAIGELYGVSPGLIARYNNLSAPYTLAVGQSLVILKPEELYTVQEGDSLYSIAGRFGVSPIQLLQNNPNLQGGMNRLYPGQVLVISLQTEPLRSIQAYGYAYPWVDTRILSGILPYQSALAPFSYGLNASLELLPLDDQALISLARQYDCAPWMHLSTMTETGAFSSERAATLLTSPERQQRLANQVVQVIVQRGYQGLDLDFEYVGPDYAEAYVSFAAMLKARVQDLGIPLIIALAPKTYADQPGVLYEGHNYRLLGEQADAVLLMTYEWGYSYGPPMAVSPLQSVRSVLDYAITEIPPEKIFLGFPNYAYDWTLPFEAGGNRARVISHEMAVELAVRYGVEIQYDEASATPYFFYQPEDGVVHEVWFEDARSTQAKLLLIEEYGLRGVGYWNDMRSFVQGFSVQNAMYTLERL